MWGPGTTPQLHRPTPESRPTLNNNRPTVVGLYGMPGCGKSFLLNQLKQELGQEHFAFYEGAKSINDVVPGGLKAFQCMKGADKEHYRQLAINDIENESTKSGKVAVIAGHFMFWTEGQANGQPVYTQSDLSIYTHILYLDVPGDVVLQRRLGDRGRNRSPASTPHLQKWQQVEKDQLQHLCYQNNILFSIMSPQPALPNYVAALLRDFGHHTEEYNLACAETKLDETLVAGQGQLRTVLVLDADKTLAAEDTGTLFWKKVHNLQQSTADDDWVLKALFSSPLQYSYTAFRQATLLYEEAADDENFERLCDDVAANVRMYPDFGYLLRLVAEQEHIGVMVITCGLRRVWEKVLEREALSRTVKVIGGGRLADGFVVTPAVKAALVARLRDAHQMSVWAFGDSPLDLDMWRRANQGIVVVGDEQSRSKTMDATLNDAIDNNGLRMRQALMPCNATPRLDTIKLPPVQLTDDEFIDSIIDRRSNVLQATNKPAANLLMMPTRDAGVFGPALRQAHHNVGWYLATEFVAGKIGTEGYEIPHVQGHGTRGYRLRHEKQTSIIALMRGREPMALGVNAAFPLAMFVHAAEPKDIKARHVQRQRTVLLVDSVVNGGETALKFVHQVRRLSSSIRILFIAGVAQRQSIGDSSLGQAITNDDKLSLVVLRISDNKFTGQGTTDTGNRLFNTTHLV